MRALLLVVLLVACSSDDDVRHVPDAPPDQCVDGEVTLATTTPAAYACHDPFTAKLTVTNGSCSPLEVQSVRVSAVVTSGACAPPGAGTFPGATIAAGEEGTVLDLTGDAFCCTSPGCPAQFQCDETFTFDVMTSKGPLTATQAVHLSLDGCDVICP
jgi:hypothetical protein